MLKFFLAALLALAATAAGAVTALLEPSLLGDGSQVDTDPLGTRVPLVLVHGLGGGPTGWDAFLHAYAVNPSWRAVFKPYSYSYASSAADVLADPTAPRTMTGLGAQFRDWLQAFYDKPATAPSFGFGGKSIVILAHSMGGLIARSMMQEYTFADGHRGGERVLHLVTAGTPHQGTPMADAFFSLGLTSIPELDSAYSGFIADSTWTNFDALNLPSGHCNAWLAALNNYAPSTGVANLGRCGSAPATQLPGFYEKIIAYGARSLQQPDIDLGRVGVYKPGSSTSLLPTYAYMVSGLPVSYPNDAVVPLSSAQFNGPAIYARAEAFACDHRYIQHGYVEFVRSWTATYTDLAFCAATPDTAYPSGTSGGYAVSGSIFGAPGGIVDTIRTVSQVERIFDWAERAYPALLQPAGAITGILEGYYERYYPGTGAYVGVRNGDVFYLPRGGSIQRVGTLADFLAQAQAAGY
ncbi:MAG: esterase/lipase family protein [Ramlibacter sp.]